MDSCLCFQVFKNLAIWENIYAEQGDTYIHNELTNEIQDYIPIVLSMPSMKDILQVISSISIVSDKTLHAKNYKNLSQTALSLLN